MVNSDSDAGASRRLVPARGDGGASRGAVPDVHELLADSEALFRHIRAVLDRPRQIAPLGAGLRRAAVLLPLVVTQGGPALILTRRTDNVEHHKGQISFPGGALDDGEEPVAGALRETYEEIGVPPSDVDVLGGLDDEEAAISGFMVSPFVGTLPYPRRLRVSPDEVHAVLVATLRTLLDPRHVRTELYRRPRGDSVVMYYYQAGSDVIWGATGRIVARFLEAVFDVPLVRAGAAR
ncbi:MAG TPA: CoA pyrophosphatase [bacterium]|nr:CoA pyrophosphatase [bacterium]